MLTVMCENYNALQNHLADYISKNLTPSNSATNNNPKKRKSENHMNQIINNEIGSSESGSSDEDSCKKPRQEQTLRPRFLGMDINGGNMDKKVTRDNPSPKAYFNCTHAPTCPVKKKVQKSVEDQSILVTTYEGEHNYTNQAKNEQGGSCLN
ncbi:unnamed protein product [Lactuca virosa]|uniref:WRKY domain-containing protein n=1 Tax=Lactuca virosa TaxID=75947 RepID=A0AAU9PMT3_9ASTR|nr:unnamed protein product [Lactuca virosa]